MPNRLCLVLLPSIFLALGCQPVSAEILPQAVTETDIAKCKYISIVEGSSGKDKTNWQDSAKQTALQQAGKIGASHVVWDYMIKGTATSGIAIGKAYICGNNE